jgi:hypothetical protein
MDDESTDSWFRASHHASPTRTMLMLEVVLVDNVKLAFSLKLLDPLVR